MMNQLYSQFRYPILALSSLILAGGAFSYMQLNTGLFPDITFPKIKVIANAGQQPVDKMMTAVTIPLENTLRRTEGLRYLRSTTSRGSCEISVFLDWSTDINTARAQIESFINQSRGDILENTSFSVEKMNPSILPVMGYSLEGDGYSQVDLKKIAKLQIKPYLAATEGVLDIAVIGGKDKEYRIILKPEIVNALGMTLGSIRSTIQNSNLLQSNGYITDYNRMYLSLTDNSIDNLDELQNLVVSNSGSRLVLLRDIAEVEVSEVQEYVQILANNKNVPLIAVIKQPDANLIEVNDRVEQKVEEIKALLPKGLVLKPYYKQADFVTRCISSIKDVLWLGLVLALVTVIVFLRSLSASLAILISIPVSISLTLVILNGLGYTFNIMTLGAIAAAIGLMIDDAVIILEQIHKIREEHPDKSITWAVGEAMAHLYPAMVGSTMSTLVIFIPFAMMTGVAGAYFKVMAYTMIVALAASFFVTWLLVPVIAILFNKSSRTPRKHIVYTRWIHWVLQRPILGVSFGALCVIILILLPSRLPSGFLPEMDEGSIVLDFNSPPGTTQGETERMLRIVNGILDTQPEVEAYSVRLGTQMGFFITEPNRGDYLIKLKDTRNKTTTLVSNEIRRQIEQSVPQLTVDFGQVIGDMLGDLMQSVQPIEIKLFGEDVARLESLSKIIASEIKKVPGTADVNSGVIIAGPSLSIVPNVPILAQMGMSPADLQFQLQTRTEGTVISTILEKEQIIDVRMLYPTAYRLSIDALQKMQIALPDGSMVPIEKVAAVTIKAGSAEIHRENQKSIGVITARLDQRDLGTTIAYIQSDLSRKISLPTGYSIKYGGAYQEQQKAFKDLKVILATAILLVFTTILFLFRRIKIALAIILVSVLGVAGCLMALHLSGTPLNVGSYTGIIMIVGIIGENAIFTYRQYQNSPDSMGHLEKIEYSIGERLRPKLMSVFAAIMALIPLAVGIGTGAQLHQPLAISVIGGLVFALPLLLVVLPGLLKVSGR